MIDLPTLTYHQRKRESSPYKWRLPEDLEPAVVLSTDGDHAAEVVAAFKGLETLCDELERVDRKIDRIWDRLNDPVIKRQIGPNHPHRLEARDRFIELRNDFQNVARQCESLICTIDSHGRYLSAEELESIGGRVHIDIVERVHLIEPETKRMATWIAIERGVVPF